MSLFSVYIDTHALFLSWSVMNTVNSMIAYDTCVFVDIMKSLPFDVYVHHEDLMDSDREMDMHFTHLLTTRIVACTQSSGTHLVRETDH